MSSINGPAIKHKHFLVIFSFHFRVFLMILEDILQRLSLHVSNLSARSNIMKSL